jgi:hypothetical protein
LAKLRNWLGYRKKPTSLPRNGLAVCSSCFSNSVEKRLREELSNRECSALTTGKAWVTRRKLATGNGMVLTAFLECVIHLEEFTKLVAGS